MVLLAESAQMIPLETGPIGTEHLDGELTAPDVEGGAGSAIIGRVASNV